MQECNCPFCSPDTTLIVKETPHCYLLVNVMQCTDSYAYLVTPKRHHTQLKELMPDELTDFTNLWTTSYLKLLDKFSVPTGNLLLNSGSHAGQTVDHVHAHIFIRSEKDTIINMKRPDRVKANESLINELRVAAAY